MASAVAIRLDLSTRQTRPCLTGAILFAGDLAAICATSAIAVILRLIFSGDFELSLYARLWPLLGLFAIAYALFGLYPGVALSPVAEIRSASSATTLVFLVLGALTFILRNPSTYSRLVFAGTWLASLLVLPIARAALRASLSKKSWWGYPVVVFGGSGPGAAVVRRLVRHPEIGLRPVAIFDNNLPAGSRIEGIPVIGQFEDGPDFARRHGVVRAMVALPDSPPAGLMSLLDAHAQTFSQVFMVPGLNGLSSVGVQARDVRRILALEIRKSLLMAGPRFAKRLLDLTMATALLVLLAPMFAIIAVLIALESPGPVLYRQKRVGYGRGGFMVWKFRTMCANADQILAEHLAKNPAMAAEWAREHKLKDDPRVTRFGKFLRKASLDELPQLWNVLMGQMSMVGPRPIVNGEIEKYGDSFELYKQVIPGLTGLWQVSGRNECTYEERVELDNYYVRNWSPWLDIYLLARTVKVVLTGYGAY